MSLFLLLPALALAQAPSPASELRLAVVVGSNAGIEGRAPLRFAHRDAKALAAALTDTGGFPADGVAVLLDEGPDTVLAAVAAARARATAAGRPTLLVFYYSGHADDGALYPAGKPLRLDALKAVLADDAFSVRVGVIDSCRGGGWTQAKGLTPAAPFQVGLPALSSEGTALLAASSGQEDAHEAEALMGSFFTHHLVAGLRGAADRSGDGRVTLHEAFDYANRLTIRDTAAASPTPQHPSFDFRLHGRQDVVLAAVGNSPTVLTLAQAEGPLQVVELSSGVVVVEAPPGQQMVRVAVPPGAYLVRRVVGSEVRSREVTVAAGAAATVEESSLTLVGTPALAAKGAEAGDVGRHQLALHGGLTPTDAYSRGVTLQASYTLAPWRFPVGWRALRVQGSLNLPTGLTQQLLRDFGVLPTAISTTRFVAGSDVVAWPWVSSGFGRRTGVALSVSLGPSLVGQQAGGLDFIQPASAAPLASQPLRLHVGATAAAGVAISLGGTGLVASFTLTQHAVFYDTGVGFPTNLALGVEWHFGG